MFSIKFKIGQQWRVFAAKEYFYGTGKLHVNEKGVYVNCEKNGDSIEVNRFNLSMKKVKEGALVFYMMLFSDTTDVMIFDEDFVNYQQIYVMQDGKTIDTI